LVVAVPELQKTQLPVLTVAILFLALLPLTAAVVVLGLQTPD
jgi:hypothetical protein